METRTRIAPSPTGYPHIGTIYQAIFDFIFAKKSQGKFIVRIEDTDRARFVEGAEEVIFKSLDWFGLNSDENPIKGGEFGPYRQSERLETYKKYAIELLEKGLAYRCFCTKERLDEMRKKQELEKKAPMYDRLCLNLTEEEVKKKLQENLSFVIRMKIPRDEKIKVHDEIVGDVEFDAAQIDDQVILKSDGFPTYHLAVVVDDYLMKISHVFRGKEWLPSTPKHVLLYKFLGWEKEMPLFIHLPLILNSDGRGKLSKRDGHATVDYYKEEGYLPEAILNYLVNIVWNHPDNKEIYPVEEFEKAFEMDPFKIKISSQAPRFDLQKLDWVNGEYIRKMSDEELLKRLEEYLDSMSESELKGTKYEGKEKLAKIIPLVKERIKKLSDFVPLTDFLFDSPEYDKEVFEKVCKSSDLKTIFDEIIKTFENLSKPLKSEDFQDAYKKLAEKLKLSNTEMFQLIRVAVSGQTVTPPLFESIEILGADETLKRFKAAQLINS